MGGLLITMEGVEGCGKSTQIRMLAERFEACGIPFELSKEPGGTARGAQIRRLLLEPDPSGERWAPKAELLLFYADRAQHLAQKVLPGLEAGKVMLLDRFEDSTRAYQGAQGIPEPVLERMAEVVLGRVKPNLTVLLDLDPAVALPRVAARNQAQADFKETRFDDESMAFHERVRSRFLAIAQREPKRVALIPAGDPPAAVAAAVWARLAPLLRSAGHAV